VTRRRDRQGGFTLMEIMISLLVMVLGLLGVMALQMTTVKGNRASRMLDKAVELVAQEMEDLRGYTTAKLDPATCNGACPSYPTITTADGVTYTRSYTIAAITGQTTLMMVTATVTYPDDQDSTSTHTQTMQMIRTTVETL
jgi:type IV pilus assembly protein PilV